MASSCPSPVVKFKNKALLRDNVPFVTVILTVCSSPSVSDINIAFPFGVLNIKTLSSFNVSSNLSADMTGGSFLALTISVTFALSHSEGVP